jgi:RHS repeat-associated protein
VQGDARTAPADSGVRDVLQMSFAGANPAPQLYAQDELPSRSNYFVGSDSTKWLSDVPNYATVVEHNLYPGVDLLVHGDSQKELEYDFSLAPGADLSQVRVSWKGAASLALDPQGNLLVGTAGQTLTERPPALYQTVNGARRTVTGRHVLNADGAVGFQADSYDHSLPLVVDPSLSYSTYLGGSGADYGYGIAVDPAGNAFVTGTTTSTNFPGVVGTSNPNGYTDAFVTKLNGAGGVVWSAYLGGATGAESDAYGAAADLAGNVYVVGRTGASDFPTSAGAYQTTNPGYFTGFVASLNAAGDALRYSTFFGPTSGPTSAKVAAVAVDPRYGTAFITGSVGPGTTGFPTTNGFQATAGGGQDAFVAELNPDGKGIAYSSFLGGSGTDAGYGIALDAADNAYVTGTTTSTNFPTKNAYQTAPAGLTTAAFVTKVGVVSGVATLTYSTYLSGGNDQGNGIAVDKTGAAYVTGWTKSSTFPTASPIYGSLSGTQDAFVSELNAAGSTLVYSTFLGGTSTDAGNGIAVDPAGEAFVVGATASTNFPTAGGAFQTSSGGGTEDAFVTKLAALGATLVYSSYLGGNGDDEATGVALDAQGTAYLTGFTSSTNFPTANPSQSVNGGGTYDAFVSKVAAVPAPPAITTITTDSGTYNNDQVTTYQNLTISGTATANATVTLSRAGVGVLPSPTTANVSGVWSYNYTGTTLAEGAYAFTATQTVGGLTSAPTNPFLVTVDRTAPAVTLTVAASTAAKQPLLYVAATDLNGLPTAASLSVGVTVYANDGVTVLYGNSSAATLADGQASFRLPFALTPGTSYKITASVTDLAGNVGTSAQQPVTVTSASSWTESAQVLTSDPLTGDSQGQLGDVQLIEPLNLDQSRGGQGGGAALVYNSDSVNVKPIVQATLQTANNAALPGTVTAALTWNSGTPATFTYSISGDQPGDTLTIAAQVGSAVSSAGAYPWSLSVWATGVATQTFSGTDYVAPQDSGPFGAGWTFGGTDRLVILATGVLRVYGTGETRWYAGTTSFTSPPGDNGTLTLSAGVYTYTAPDGQTWTFDSNGNQTGWKSADAQEALAYRYDGSNRLTGMTAIDGALTTFTYGTNLPATIKTVNNRVTTLAYDGTALGSNLTQVTNPDGGVHTFSYDASHRVTGETFANLQNEWSYGAAGALATATWGATSSGGVTNPSATAVSPAAIQGLSAAVVGPFLAKVTDPTGHATASQLDGQGRVLQQIAADGGLYQYARDANGRVTVATDPLGRATTYTRDSAGYVTGETLPNGTTLAWQYQSGFHALTTYTDERGYNTTSAYDSSGHLTSTTDALGDVTAYGYSASGLLTSVTTPRGFTTSYQYDTNRRLTAVTDALNHVTSYGYDANGYQQTVTDALGRVTTSLNDVMGRVTVGIDALGGRTTYTYNAAGLALTSTDPLGNQTSTVYDSFNKGLVAQSIEGVGSVVQRSTVPIYDAAGRTTATRDADGWTNKTAFDPASRATGTTDALGNKTLSAYDLAGQSTASRNQLGNQPGDKYNLRGWVTSNTDAAGNVTTTAYDAAGNVTSVTDPLNHTTTYLYDALNRSTGHIDPLNHRVTTTYDADANVSTVTDANGNVTSYAYDALDRATMTTEAVGTAAQRTSTVAYDAVGNVTSSTDFLGNRTTTAYDALNRATVTTDPLGHAVTTAYDKAGNATTVTDALSKVTSYAYDALNRLLATTDPLGHVATQVADAADDAVASIDPLGNYARAVYDQLHRAIGSLDLRGGYTQTGVDAAGGTTAVTDSVGNATGYVNDSLGRQSVATDPTGARTTTTYDAAGNVSTVTDRDGRQQVFHYDSANRQTGTAWLSSGGVTVNLLTYTYDNNNNQLTAADYNGTVTSAYDALDRLTAQTDVFGLALTYSYDSSSRVTQRSDSKGGVLTYVYDNADRLTSEKLTGSGSAARVDLGYDNRDELTGLTRFTDVAGSTLVGTTVYAYDDAQRLTSIVNKTGAAATLSYYQYSLDKAGRSTQESWQSQNTTGGTISGTHTYAYDTTNQLTAADGTPYTWDLNGNSTNAGKQTGAANRLSNDGTFTYTYDAQGDLTQQSKGSGLETWYYGYNTLNQLTSVRETTDGTTNELTVTYAYDVYNRRVEEDRWATGGVTTVTRTAYDAAGVAWADLNGSNAVQTRYLAGPGVNQWLAQITGSADQWLLADRLGSIRDVAASAGTMVLDHTEYGAFGAVNSDTGVAAASAYGMDGQREDRADNFVQSDERVWNGRTIQWLQEDPAQFGGGDGNLRRPVGNDPTNAVDPSGLYERDVHFYMTYYIANKLGLGDISTNFIIPGTRGTHASQAYVIAWADQQTDDTIETGPFLSYSARSTFHFRTDKGEYTKRMSDIAEAISIGAIDEKEKWPDRLRDVEKPFKAHDLSEDDFRSVWMGIGLHAAQDSFSHEGFSPEFEISHKGGFSPELGHLTAGHDPDYPYKDLDKAVDMAHETYRLLRNYMESRYPNSEIKATWDSMKDDIKKCLAVESNKLSKREEAWKDLFKRDFPGSYGYMNLASSSDRVGENYYPVTEEAKAQYPWAVAFYETARWIKWKYRPPRDDK